MKVKTNGKIAVFYGRVSTEEQANHGYSLEMQKKVCEAWAKAHGYTIVAFFIDAGKTGTNMNRKGIKDLLAYVKKNKVDIVIVWKLDRLSRRTIDFYAEIMSVLEKNDTTIASVTDRIEDINEISSVLIGVYLGQAEDEVKNTKRRTKDCMRSRAEQGYFLGKAPLGYLNAKDKDGHGIIVIDPDKAHFIKRAFELRATGIYSYKTLSKKMFEEGFINKYGKPYPARKFEWLLKNVVYMGKVQWGKEVFDNGKHEPIITPELFYRAQLMRGEERKSKSSNEFFTYTNYIKCAKCGCSLVAESKMGAHNTGPYIYYHCTNYKGQHERQKNIPQRLIDEAIQEVLESFDISDKELKLVKKDVYKGVQELQQYEKQSLNSLKKQYEDLTDVISNGIKLKLSGALKIDNDTFNELQHKWQTEKDRLAIKISELSANSNDTMTRINLLADFANRVPELYLKATPNEKRLIIATITDSIEYYDGVLTVKLKPMFEHLRLIKAERMLSENLYRTLETRSNKGIEEYTKNKDAINQIKDYRTRKTIMNTKKELHIEAQFVNGAEDGIRTHAYRNHNPRS